MKQLDLTISIMTSDPTDLRNQNELRLIKEELTDCGADLVTINSRRPTDSTQKSGELDILIGSVKLALPASALIPVLTSFIKHYFDARKKRGLKISRPGGASIQITGYSARQTTELLRLLDTPQKQEKKPSKTLSKR
jgi:hypothetical protein